MWLANYYYTKAEEVGWTIMWHFSQCNECSTIGKYKRWGLLWKYTIYIAQYITNTSLEAAWQNFCVSCVRVLQARGSISRRLHEAMLEEDGQSVSVSKSPDDKRDRWLKRRWKPFVHQWLVAETELYWGSLCRGHKSKVEVYRGVRRCLWIGGWPLTSGGWA